MSEVQAAVAEWQDEDVTVAIHRDFLGQIVILKLPYTNYNSINIKLL